jgi:hypothetical protein
MPFREKNTQKNIYCSRAGPWNISSQIPLRARPGRLIHDRYIAAALPPPRSGKGFTASEFFRDAFSRKNSQKNIYGSRAGRWNISNQYHYARGLDG